MQSKKEELRDRQPGAVSPNEPKIIWASILQRADIVSEGYSSVVRITNTMLEEILSTRCNHFWMNLDSFLADPVYFALNGQLTGNGKVKYWRSVDKILEGFDKYEISLRSVSEEEHQLMLQKKAEREKKEKEKKEVMERMEAFSGFRK